jgi:hypothetical protein
MRHPIAEEIATAFGNDRKPMPRVFFERIALKRIELVTDEDRDGHGTLRDCELHLIAFLEIMLRVLPNYAGGKHAVLAASPSRIFG